MNTFIVEGRRFSKKRHAIEFARRLACEYDRSIEVHVETTDTIERRHRSWVCRMHPDGVRLPFELRKTAPSMSAAR